MSFQPLCHFENSILIAIVVDTSKRFSLSIFSFAKYTSSLTALLTFRYLSLDSPLFHCFQAFCFQVNCINYSSVPPKGFFVLLIATSCPSTYLICSFKKSNFDRLPTVLYFYRNSLIFCDDSLLKLFLYTSISQLPSFPTRSYVDRFYRFCSYSQVTNK